MRRVVPLATEWQRIGDQIDTAFIFARANFVNVDRRLHQLYIQPFRRFRVEHEKLLTPSRLKRHDHGASSLPAAINAPLTFFPLGKNCEGFTRKQTSIKNKA